MKKELISLLCCPACGGDLSLQAAVAAGDRIASGQLQCVKCRKNYPIENHVPRFVPPENYATNFGMQWNQFRKTQLDSHSGHPISRDRFLHFTGWKPEQLAGKRVLDIGCGAGRFAEIALSCGAKLVALDYSSAVDACWANHGDKNNLESVIQGDIYHLPFKPGQFDFVYCLGVLQHTPDVRKAFFALPQQLRPGGQLAIDLYPKLWRTYVWPRYWVRPVTKRMAPQRLFGVVGWMVKYLLPVSVALGRVPLLGRKLRHLIPVSNYEGIFPLSTDQLREWALLDTFDMLAPAHDHPQTPATLKGWLQESGLRNTEVFRSGFLVGRGTRSTQETSQ